MRKRGSMKERERESERERDRNENHIIQPFFKIFESFFQFNSIYC